MVGGGEVTFLATLPGDTEVTDGDPPPHQHHCGQSEGFRPSVGMKECIHE